MSLAEIQVHVSKRKSAGTFGTIYDVSRRRAFVRRLRRSRPPELRGLNPRIAPPTPPAHARPPERGAHRGRQFPRRADHYLRREPYIMTGATNIQPDSAK
ncbi:hypothetical protein EVAR_67471_1 [Eumeta japonica]|uniref:Uncharacterized protein n=1 Tax=Eumeta variegata TaxID=151549 RepID=A0A4C1ZCY1_EUMVA|nr:hypothetical protein EVAR_67471_1 [Eumeta japonica]